MKQLWTRLTRVVAGADMPAAISGDTGKEADAMIRKGNSLEDQDRPDAALVVYRQALEIAPDHPRVHLNLGNALLATGRTEDAIAHYHEAMGLDPGYAFAYFNLGNALQRVGRSEEAISAYQKALRLVPSLPGGRYALGRLLMEQKRPEEAIPFLEAMSGKDTDAEQCRWLLARAYNLAAFSINTRKSPSADQTELNQAVALCRKAIALDPAYAEALYNLGTLLERAGDMLQAEHCYRQSLALNPSNALAHYNLGVILEHQKDLSGAMTCFRQAIDLQPDMSYAHAKLGFMLMQDSRFEEAEASYQKALSLAPELGEVAVQLGELSLRENKSEQAIAYFHHALERNADDVAALRWLAQAYLSTGQHEEAIRLMRCAESVKPGTADVQSCILFMLTCMPGIPTPELVGEHFAFDRYCQAYTTTLTQHSNSPDPERRLRIGYVSGDFISHAVAAFIWPLLKNHCRDNVEVFCYHANPKSDKVTERIRSASDHWREIFHLDDPSALAQILDDQIDILVDLSGHSFLNRLPLFAHKPAPIQVTWLGYLATTGLRVMDYRICDVYTDPPGMTENQHSEQLARLPCSQWCYRPLISLPEIGAPPVVRNGHLTLGSFNSVHKLNATTIRLWAELLHTLPQAILQIGSVSDVAAQRYLVQEFAASGILPDRLAFRGRLMPKEYFSNYNDIDICLDSFPYNGGTTSLDALLMGVPVVTLAGDRSISRGGVSILSNLGLQEFIAATPQDYIRIVQELARNITRLAELRATLRERMEHSPLMDIHAFVNDMERLYRQMWQEWVSKQ